MIIYTNSGDIIGLGDVSETSTHYVIDTTYFDKNRCNLADIEVPSDLSIEEKNYKYLDAEFVKIKNKIISNFDFNEALGIEVIGNLLDIADSNKDIRNFKYVLDHTDGYIDTGKQMFVDGMNYLLGYGYITQEIYDKII